MRSVRAGALALLLAGCGLTPRPEVVEAVAAVDRDRLAADVEAYAALGPRPVEDEAATERAVAWLHDRLSAAGLTAVEEPVPVRRDDSRLVARVRRVDTRPGAEPVEIELPGFFAGYGPRILSGQTRRLRRDGWDVLSYVLRAGEEGAVSATAPNLLVEIPGTSGRPGIVELSAHYDSVPGSPGADDDASGVAALLEIGRVLGGHPPARTVRLCFFAAEEAGLLGSEVHVQNVLAADEPVVALFNLDSIGWCRDEPGSQDAPVRIPLIAWMPDTGDFVAVIGDWDSGALGNLFEASIEAYVPELPYDSANRVGGFFADARRSDHAHYWDADIPAVFLTDTAEFRSDAYHTPRDVPAAVDVDFLARVTRATLAAVLERAARDP